MTSEMHHGLHCQACSYHNCDPHSLSALPTCSEISNPAAYRGVPGVVAVVG